jgi:hypothetical protein
VSIAPLSVAVAVTTFGGLGAFNVALSISDLSVWCCGGGGLECAAYERKAEAPKLATASEYGGSANAGCRKHSWSFDKICAHALPIRSREIGTGTSSVGCYADEGSNSGKHRINLNGRGGAFVLDCLNFRMAHPPPRGPQAMSEAKTIAKLALGTSRLALFGIGWIFFILGTSLMLVIWTVMFKAGYSEDRLDLLSSIMIGITDFGSIVLGLIGLWRWYDDGKTYRSLRGIAAILMFLLSIPAAILVLMMLALIIPPMFGIDPKTGQPR